MVKIIYIAGEGRSGSTILDRILGSINGVTSCNEIYRIMQEGFNENLTCSCLRKFYDCSYWSPIADKMNLDANEIQEYLALQRNLDRTREFFSLAHELKKNNKSQDFLKYKSHIRKLYQTISEISDDNVLVDSSKNPSRALILSTIPEFELYVIHLVRDSRAVAHAWSRKKYISEDGRYLDQHPIYKTCLKWISRNLFSETLNNHIDYTRVRYEDLTKSPKEALLNIMNKIPFLIDHIGEVDAVFQGSTVNLKPIHSIAGNPDRYKTGHVSIKPDNRWKESLAISDKCLINSLTFPLLIRYGYL